MAADAPEKSRKYAVELSEKNWFAWQHYRECKAVAHFPDDPIVRAHAAALHELYESIKESRQHELLLLVAGLRRK